MRKAKKTPPKHNSSCEACQPNDGIIKLVEIDKKEESTRSNLHTFKQAYHNKFRDPRWQKKRLEVFDLAEWKCEMCGDDKSELQLHHWAYLKNTEPWDYPTSILSCLCDSCHTRVSSNREKFIIGQFHKFVNIHAAGIEAWTQTISAVTKSAKTKPSAVIMFMYS